jgi:RNA polymerase sigma-70 factor (ECF subfamily)
MDGLTGISANAPDEEPGAITGASHWALGRPMTAYATAQRQHDIDLLRAAQGGQVSAFNQLVLTYQGLVYNVAYRILGDADAAADATQDTFLKAYQHLPRFRGGSPKAWLLRIVTNTCYDQLRTWRRRQVQSLDDTLVAADHLSLLADDRELPDVSVLRGELTDAIQAIILQLPPNQRITLVLADLQGLRYEEIAAALGVSMGTVKSRLSRARARVRDALLESGDLLPDSYRSGQYATHQQAVG